MYRFFAGVFVGELLIAIVFWAAPTSPKLGVVASSGDFLGIYHATPTDMVLRDGQGSALLTDNAGRVIVTSTTP